MREAVAFAEVDTEERLACWLAQIGHESGRLRYLSELWGPTAAQKRYERNFAQPWPRSSAEARQSTFRANRLAFFLGNSRPGDGSRFRGHGWIQTTGRANHAMTRDGLRDELGSKVPDFVEDPSALATPYWAAMSAALYWRKRDLNRYADAGDFVGLTRRINGGTNGMADRQSIYARAQTLLLFADLGGIAA